MSASFDLDIDQGATYPFQLTVLDTSNNPLNLTGYTATMILALDQRTPPYLTLTTGGGGIVLGGVLGTINITISSAQTQAMPFQRGLYAIEITDPSNNITRVLEGALFLDQRPGSN